MYTSLHLLFDTIIAGTIIISGLLFWFILRDATITKKGWFFRYRAISFVFLFLLGGAFTTVFYGSFIEPRIITTNRQNATLFDDGGAPLKIALVSDFHAGPYKKENFFKRVAEKIRRENPDLLLLDGDLVESSADEMKYLTPIFDLAQSIPSIAVLGNHDAGDGTTRKDFFVVPEKIKTIVDLLLQRKILLLQNQNIIIDNGARKFILGGTKEYISREESVAATFAGTPKNLPRILLAHNPDTIYEAIKEKVNLVLSGHTHGGQIRLPLYGAVGEPFTELGRNFDKGWFNFGNTELFISSGLGEAGTRARLFNPPEIVILNIN